MAARATIQAGGIRERRSRHGRTPRRGHWCVSTVCASASPVSPRLSGCRSIFLQANFSPCSARRGVARPRCCACSPASRRRTRDASCSPGRISPGCRPIGGRGQGVALARSLVERPRVLLRDEPLAALDKKLRGETQFELMQLQEKLGLTFIIVTHDQQEAMTVADRIGVMDHGRLIQVATPTEIYERPNSRWVADFIGDVNLIEGRVIDVGASGTVVVSAAAGRLRALSPEDAKPGDVIWVALRPEKVRIAPEPPGSAEENCVAGEVTDIGYLGDLSIYKVRLDSGTIMKTAVANVTRLAERPIAWDERVWLSWAPEAAMVLTR